jgi:hypothetical protein
VPENDSRPDPSLKEPAPPPAATAHWAEILRDWRWPIAFVLVGLFAFLAYRETLVQARRAAGAAARVVEKAAQRLWSGNVTETFVSSIPEFDPDGAGNLEVATLTATEIFSRSDERKILGDTFSLGVTTTEIRVPVTYRYHLRLDDPWHLEIRGGVCYVRAPPVRPSLPPAIHTNRMEKRAEQSWLRFDADDQMTALERSITPTLVLYARDERHLGLVRDNARRAVEDFVRIWLLREDQWGPDRVRIVRVVFPGEEGFGLQDSSVEVPRPASLSRSARSVPKPTGR